MYSSTELGASLADVVFTSTFFFFSSRRRHTRFDCDWSSDVCSSDLGSCPPPAKHEPRGSAHRRWPGARADGRVGGTAGPGHRERVGRGRSGRGAASVDCDAAPQRAGSLGRLGAAPAPEPRSEEHTSELQSQSNIVCRLLLEKKK